MIRFDADFLEKKAARMGLQYLFLLTTRTADWYAYSFVMNSQT